MLEILALPVVHLLGAALNFAMILTTSRPVFNLPFRSLKEVTEARDLEPPYSWSLASRSVLTVLRYHFSGVAGAGMGPLACLMRSRGHAVTRFRSRVRPG